MHELYTKYPKIVRYGAETIYFLSPKLWAMIQQNMKDSTITDKIFDTNSSFHVKYHTTVFQEFFGSVDKTLILGGRLDTRPPLYEIMRFIRQLVYTMLTNNNHTLFHLW